MFFAGEKIKWKTLIIIKKLNKKQVEDGAITGRQAAAGTHNGRPYYILILINVSAFVTIYGTCSFSRFLCFRYQIKTKTEGISCSSYSYLYLI